MSLLKCDFRVVGPIQTNCYFLYREDTKDCLIIDPGYEADKIEDYVQKKQLHVTGILLTHGHFDHITAADEVRKKFQTKIYASKEEEELLADPGKNVSVMMGDSVGLKADAWLEDGQELEMLGETMRCILTPDRVGAILRAAEKSSGNVYMSVLREGRIHLLVQGSEFFDLGKGSTNVELLRERWTNEIHWFTDLIDALRMEDILY